MKSIFAILFVILNFSLFAQEVESPSYNLMLKGLLSHDVPELSVDGLKPNDSSTLYLDARALEEYQVSHINGALWVGYDDFDATRLKAVPKDQKLVVYCSVGYRSEKIAEKLIALGYTNVSNLYGGIFEWVNEGHPVVDMNDKPTDKVHAYNKAWGIWLDKGEKVY